MTELLTHFQDNSTAYIAGLVAAIPIIFVTRKYSMPILQYLIETIIYLVLMHTIMHFLVAMTKWFKEQSSFDRAFDRKSEVLSWTTPWVEFWQKELYSPVWIYYAEIVTGIIIILLVLRFRPLRFGKRKKKKPAPKKKGMQNSKQDYSWKKKGK